VLFRSQPKPTIVVPSVSSDAPSNTRISETDCTGPRYSSRMASAETPRGAASATYSDIRRRCRKPRRSTPACLSTSLPAVTMMNARPNVFLRLLLTLVLRRLAGEGIGNSLWQDDAVHAAVLVVPG